MYGFLVTVCVLTGVLQIDGLKDIQQYAASIYNTNCQLISNQSNYFSSECGLLSKCFCTSSLNDFDFGYSDWNILFTYRKDI
jgi:hypothetical protein